MLYASKGFIVRDVFAELIAVFYQRLLEKNANILRLCLHTRRRRGESCLRLDCAGAKYAKALCGE